MDKAVLERIQNSAQFVIILRNSDGSMFFTASRRSPKQVTSCCGCVAKNGLLDGFIAMLPWQTLALMAGRVVQEATTAVYAASAYTGRWVEQVRSLNR